MKKTTVHRAHNKKTQCSYCKQFALFKETGYIRISVARLIDWGAIINGRFCSFDCAIKYLQAAQEKKHKENEAFVARAIPNRTQHIMPEENEPKRFL